MQSNTKFWYPPYSMPPARVLNLHLRTSTVVVEYCEAVHRALSFYLIHMFTYITVILCWNWIMISIDVGVCFKLEKSPLQHTVTLQKHHNGGCMFMNVSVVLSFQKWTNNGWKFLALQFSINKQNGWKCWQN